MARIPSTDLALAAFVGKRLQLRSCYGTQIGRLVGRAVATAPPAARTQWKMELDSGDTEIFWPEHCVISSAQETLSPANDSSLDLASGLTA